MEDHEFTASAQSRVREPFRKHGITLHIDTRFTPTDQRLVCILENKFFTDDGCMRGGGSLGFHRNYLYWNEQWTIMSFIGSPSSDPEDIHFSIQDYPVYEREEWATVYGVDCLYDKARGVSWYPEWDLAEMWSTTNAYNYWMRYDGYDNRERVNEHYGLED